MFPSHSTIEPSGMTTGPSGNPRFEASSVPSTGKILFRSASDWSDSIPPPWPSGAPGAAAYPRRRVGHSCARGAPRPGWRGGPPRSANRCRLRHSPSSSPYARVGVAILLDHDLEETVTDPNDPHALSGEDSDSYPAVARQAAPRRGRGHGGDVARSSPRPAAAAAAPARPAAQLDRRRRQARPRRHAQGRLRRRRHGRDAQPLCGRDAHRRVAGAEPLRPALDPEPRPLDQSRPRDGDQRERRRDRVRDQAPPGRRVPQRQVVQRRRPDLLDPAHVEAGELRVGAVRGRHRPRRAEGGQPDHRPRSRSSSRTPTSGPTSSTGTRGSCRTARPTSRSRSAPARSCSSRSSPAPRARSRPTRTTGSRASRTSTRSRSPRSTTTRPG